MNAATQRGIPLRPDPGALYAESMRSLSRAAAAVALHRLDRSTLPGQHVRERGWSDDRNVDLILRAAVSPTSLTNSVALSQVAVAFLQALQPASAGAGLLARGIGLNFAGAASISVPGLAAPVADFVGEGAPIPVVTAQSSAGPTLIPHKIAAITTLTSEILNSANVETLVRQALIDATGPAVDRVLFSANAAAADRPAGLLNGIAALTPASVSGGKTDALADDLQTLATAVAPVAGNGEIVLIAAPAQAVAVGLRLLQNPYSVLISASLPARTVIAVAANAVVSAVEGTPQIDASVHAEVHRESAPGEIVDVGGVMARPVGSIFQTDQVALRLRWPISWALRTPTALAWMNAVNW